MFNKKVLEMEGFQGRKEKKTGSKCSEERKWCTERRWKSTGGSRKTKEEAYEIGAWSLDDTNERRRIYTMRLNAVTSAAKRP